jgi:hypothetical protein
LLAGGVHDTTDEELVLEVAVTAVGAPGVVAGVAADDGSEDILVPAASVAVTVKV